jgi:hypothetical protein
MSEETYSDQGPQCPYCGRQYTADIQRQRMPQHVVVVRGDRGLTQ